MNKYGDALTFDKPDNGLSYWLEQIELYAPKAGWIIAMKRKICPCCGYFTVENGGEVVVDIC